MRILRRWLRVLQAAAAFLGATPVGTAAAQDTTRAGKRVAAMRDSIAREKARTQDSIARETAYADSVAAAYSDARTAYDDSVRTVETAEQARRTSAAVAASRKRAKQLGAPAVIAEAKRMIGEKTTDPEAVRFRNVRIGRDGWICGEFNAKNAFGGYTGYRRFVVMGEGDDGIWDGQYAARGNQDAWRSMDEVNTKLISEIIESGCQRKLE